MSLSKDAIVKALAKLAVWGVGDKKKAVLLALVTNRDTLLARVGEPSQDLMAVLDKWIPMTKAAVRPQRFKVVDVVGHLYKISIILDAYQSSLVSRSTRSDPLKHIFADIQSMMRQARQDAESTLLDESNSARVKLLPRELDRLYLVDGHKPHDELCQQCAFCGHDFLDEPDSNGPALEENTQKLLAYDKAKADADARKSNNQPLMGAKGTAITRAPHRQTHVEANLHSMSLFSARKHSK
jgi:hypothetical protein